MAPQALVTKKKAPAAGRWSILRGKLSCRHEPRHPLTVRRDHRRERGPHRPAVQPDCVHGGLHAAGPEFPRSEEHTSELQSHSDLVCRLLLEKKKKTKTLHNKPTR